MDYSTEKTIFFCSISKDNHFIYSHGGDLELQALSAAAIKCAPLLHSRYSHTAENRTFAFLIDRDNYTYFVIADSAVGSAAAHRFLELMRDSFLRSAENGVHDKVVPVVSASLESFSRSSGSGKDVWIDVLLQRRLSSRVFGRRNGRRLWWRCVKIVVVVDVVLCLVLFGIWLAVCGGFECVG